MGGWNADKFKVLALLELRRSNGLNEPIDAFGISNITGVDVESLETLLPKWTRWGYISRVEVSGVARLVESKKRLHKISYGYKFCLEKGRRWLGWFDAHFPELSSRYWKELLEYQKQLRKQ